MGSLAWFFVADAKFVKRAFPTPPWMPASFKKHTILNPMNGNREDVTGWTFKKSEFEWVDEDDIMPDEVLEQLGDRQFSGSRTDRALRLAIAEWNKKRKRRKNFEPLPNLGEKAFPTVLIPQDEHGAVMKFPGVYSRESLEELSENLPDKRDRELFELLAELKRQEKRGEGLYLYVSY